MSNSVEKLKQILQALNRKGLLNERQTEILQLLNGETLTLGRLQTIISDSIKGILSDMAQNASKIGEIESYVKLLEESTKEGLGSNLELIRGLQKTVDETIITYIKDQNDTITKQTNKKIEDLNSVIVESLKEVNKTLEKIKKDKPKNGKDADESVIVEKVLARIILPTYEKFILDGQSVVDEINKLPVTEEHQIDASHIKNLPEKIGRGGGFGVREAPKDGNSYVRKDREWVVVDLSSTDEKVKLSASDPTAGYLDAKLQEGVTAIKAGSSAGFAIKGSGGSTAVLFGAGGGNNATFYDGVKLDAGTASRVMVTDASKNISYATMTASDLDAIPSSYLKTTPYSLVTSHTSLTSAHRFIDVDTTGGNIVLTLPNPSTLSDGHSIVVKDVGGSAYSNNINVNQYGTETIDGEATYVIDSNYGSQTFIYSNGNWVTINSLPKSILYAGSGSESIDYYGRVLRVGTSDTSLDWYSRTLVGEWVAGVFNSTKLYSQDGDGNSWVLGSESGNPTFDIGFAGATPHFSLNNSAPYYQLPRFTTNGFVKTTNSDGTLDIDTNTYLTTTDADSAYFKTDQTVAQTVTVSGVGKMYLGTTKVVFGNTTTDVLSNGVVYGTGNTQTAGVAGSLGGIIFGKSNTDAKGSQVLIGGSNSITNTGGIDTSSTVLVGLSNSADNQRAGAFGVLNTTSGNNSWAIGYGNSVGASAMAIGQNLTGAFSNAIRVGQDNNNYWQLNTSGVSTWLSGGSTIATLNSTGLGIGATAPTYQLDIQSSASGRTARIKSTLSGGQADLILDSGAVASPAIWFRRGGSNNFQIRSNNSSNFSIYSYRSAPNAESLVIDGVTHNATFTGGITAGGTITANNGITIADAKNVALNTTTGTKIGTATTQKLGFFNATPVVQPANTVAIDDTLVNLGLRASGGSANFTLKITNNLPQTLKGYTVATLPTGVTGDVAYVTDALAPTWGAAVVGGGTVKVPVFYDGTNWIVA